jgi:hypothetical protein
MLTRGFGRAPLLRLDDGALRSAREFVGRQVVERLPLDGLSRGTSSGEARHHRAVRTPESGRVWVAKEVEAVAFGQIGCFGHLSHVLAGVTRSLPDPFPILVPDGEGCAPLHTKP